MKQKHIIFTLVIIACIAVVGVWYASPKQPKTLMLPKGNTPATETIKATFLCKDDKSIDAQFSQSSVSLSLSDGRTETLDQAISGSGARYANKDESFVFWNKGDTAFIEEKGETTFSDCVQKE